MEKENQRIQITKRLLREALLRLMKKKPLDKINITELCQESEINRATFYRHYNIPRDILLEMEMDIVKKAYSRFDLTSTTDMCKELEGLCYYLYENAELIKIFVSNNSEEDITELFNKIFGDFVEKKKSLLESYRVDSSSLKLISTYISGGGYYMLRQWLCEDIQKTPKEVAELLLSFMNYTATFIEKNEC